MTWDVKVNNTTIVTLYGCFIKTKDNLRSISYYYWNLELGYICSINIGILTRAGIADGECSQSLIFPLFVCCVSVMFLLIFSVGLSEPLFLLVFFNCVRC